MLLLFAMGTAHAQTDSATSRLLDSLSIDNVNRVDTTAATTVESPEEESNVLSYPMDTTVYSSVRSIPADTLRLLRNEKAYAYRHWLDSALRSEEEPEPGAQASRKVSFGPLSTFFSLLQWLLGALVVFVIGLIIYKLFLGKGSMLLRNRKNVEVEITEEEEVSPEHFSGQIAAAEAKKDFRLATRYRYLRSLYVLSEKGFVVPGTDKTNYQYMSELRSKAPELAPGFQKLVYLYEHIWYGEYPLSESFYRVVADGFIQFTQPIDA